MKTTYLILVLAFCMQGAFPQKLIGAWENTKTLKNGEKIKSVLILADGYQVLSTYNAKTGKFISTNGGTWRLDGNIMTEKVEFHTEDPSRIGKEISFEIKVTANKIQIVGSEDVLTRIDDGKPGALSGPWIMSGRIRNGKTQLRNTNRPRKTMKLLSGTRFQWIAYNVETKEFKGTGGGTYTTTNGKYTENIEFFSRDHTKTGRKLQFDYEMIDGKWHHKGLSSKGSPIHEIWSKRK